MAHQPSLRRRDGHNRLDDDYATDNIYGRNPQYWDAGDAGPPRRQQSERHRQRPSPPEYSERPRRHRDEEPPRRHRDQDQRRSDRDQDRDRHGGRDRRPRSPPRESRNGDRLKEPRSSRYERDYPSRDPASARHNARGYTSDDEPRQSHRRTQTEGIPHRPRYASPDAKPRGGRGRDYPSPPSDDRQGRRRGGGGGGRGGSPDAVARPRARDHDREYGRSGRDGPDRDYAKARQRPRSHDKSPTRGRPPPAATGGRPAAAGVGTSAARRQSMPASTKAKWWQNPLLQAGARTAFSAGAQAAMQNRKGGGDWVGAKGAKVASAAIGAALMDGFANRNGGKGRDERDGDGGGGGGGRGRSRSRDRDDDKRRSSGGGGRGGGGGGSTRDKLLREGFNFVTNKAMDRNR